MTVTGPTHPSHTTHPSSRSPSNYLPPPVLRANSQRQLSTSAPTCQQQPATHRRPTLPLLLPSYLSAAAAAAALCLCVLACDSHHTYLSNYLPAVAITIAGTTTMTCCNNNKRPTQSQLLLLLPLLLPLLSVTPSVHAATVYDVSADGSSGLDLYEAMDLAEAGDTVSLADGTYDQAVVSVRDGASGSPITVVGGPGAIINGDYSSRSVFISHSFITIQVGATVHTAVI